MNLPSELKYAKTHEWIRADGDLLVVGITDHAQDQLGDLVYVGDVKVGARLQAGETAGVVESVKAASDIYAPVAGEIVAFNEDLSASPEQLNQEPYAAWIFKLRPDNMADTAGLLDAAGYQAAVGAE
ncbi:glycine cleavage system protein GcvH [Pigmentiphaga sp.]|uniref:glycine cleavage system protein GcvH n=1 Tax=Pigmentiphaga sp. TaxID=1977564 RepID=UPI00128E48D0|nr:glycine cleavage system protein GcvH [Pigmentiphaga sp.]MPS27070.1 glycine cleavage system protein GcvH [Alcaligenaceae bacterium SAGV5]MPS51806.1 glycine cleavage system protein GcvH [Alcaligenaceae bacterium SAGV3]MPT58496.1 glycine cleavage system protein GcvH [Alcaligenaceae bacterium]